MYPAALLNGITLISITEHEYGVVIFSKRLIDLTHPLVRCPRILFDKDCFIRQMKNVPVMVTVKIRIKSETFIPYIMVDLSFHTLDRFIGK